MAGRPVRSLRPRRSLAALGRCVAFATCGTFATLGALASLGPSRSACAATLSHADPSSADAVAQRVNELLERHWRALGVVPAEPADDAEFLRRACLDLTGVVPRASRVRAFLADSRPDKRSTLVDELLSSSRYATHMANVWSNRILPAGADEMHAREAQGLHAWLQARFAANLRYDNLVSGLLLTTGDDELGPGLFFRAHDLAPEKIAASAAELFLGVDLQCAQCHDHPYAAWSQRDFWGLAAFFAQVASPSDPSMTEGSYRLVDKEEGDVTLPNSQEATPPRYPRGALAERDGLQTRREQFAFWLASRDNAFLSRAAVNWAWEHLFGQRLTPSTDRRSNASAPVDERAANELAANELALEELARFFATTGFDVRQLLGVLAKTRAYQLSSRRPASPSVPREAFARMHPKPLTPEQLYDSFQLLAPPMPRTETTESVDLGIAADPQRMEFVRRMRVPPGERTEYRGGTLQALLLMNGRTTSTTTDPAGRLFQALDAPFLDDEERLEAIFLSTLSRLPDAEERVAFRAMDVGEKRTGDERQRLWSDVLWAALNSTEFAFVP